MFRYLLEDAWVTKQVVYSHGNKKTNFLVTEHFSLRY